MRIPGLSARTFALAMILLGHLTVSPRAGAQVFGPARFVNTDAIGDSRQDRHVRAATDGAGNWVVVWEVSDLPPGVDADLLVARSDDNGVTWSAPIALNSNAGTDTGDDLFPNVVTDGSGNWIAVWESGDSLGGTIGTDIDVLMARSSDNGATWTSPAPLNGNAATDSSPDGDESSPPSVATDGTGNWVAVWMSSDTLSGTLPNDFDVFVARSVDNGATWTPPAALNSDAASETIVDDRPQVVTGGAGTWLAMWRRGQYDIYLARSTDNGATWTTPSDVSNAAFARRFHLMTDGAGNWVLAYAAWSGDTIEVTRSTDDGATWSPETTLIDGGALNGTPNLASDGAGNWLVTWNSVAGVGNSLGGDWDLLTARSTDNGATWTRGAALNYHAMTDFETDIDAHVLFDGTDTWIAFWSSGALDVFTYDEHDIVMASNACDTNEDCGLCAVCGVGDRCQRAPRSGCRGPIASLKGTLAIRDGDPDRKDSVKWKWVKGAETSLGDFGEPITTDDYAVCLFGESGGTPSLLFRATAPAGGDCDGKPCWQAKGMTRIRYRDVERTPEGLQKLDLQAGTDGRAKTKARVTGEGLALRPFGMPSLPLDLPVTVQLQGQHDECWEARYFEAGVRQNDSTGFKAKPGSPSGAYIDLFDDAVQ